MPCRVKRSEKNMKKTIIYLMFFMLVCMNMLSVSGENIVTDPETIAINIIGGDSITMNITIYFPCNNPSSFSISTNVTPNGTGLNITYLYDFPETIYKNVGYSVEMVVNASIHIAPDIYNITTIFYCECQTTSDGSGDDGDWDHSGGYSWTPGIPDDEVDEPPDDEPEPDTVELKEPDDEIDAPDRPSNLVYFCIFGFIMLVIGLVIIVLYSRKKKDKKAEKPGEQKNEQNKNK